ncbi:MAG: NAD(P)-dependent dehydrogenase (short-subunit alcohol dehydrogenase family) [Gammaproteobacteria bacterium]|jgi:NAD(P)-dependent dehydrogenase (short-subunit alcohol dehydrogenase family)
MSGRVKDKITVITGAGTGIGQAAMVLFGREGATVVGVSRTQSALDKTLEMTRSAGGDGFVIAQDLSNEAGANAVIEATMAAYGRIDILVQAAGVGWSWGQSQSPGSMDDIANTSTDKWHEVMSINLDSVFYMCRGVVPIMQKQGGGSIVNVASISGFVGMTTAHTYCAGKGATINLTRAMAATYAMDGIRTNCVCPGYTDTPMIAPVMNMFDDKVVADVLTPMQRAGTPEEMAYGCLYLGSDEATYCNGVVLPIDGGTTARQ